jgi:hypothetical protein
VAGWDDVARVALALPGAEERLRHGVRQWRVHERLFVWERPLRPREVHELGARAPQGPILAARVEHSGAREALLAEDPGIYFTTSHFTRSPVVLARLQPLSPAALEELVVEAWLLRAPARLVREFSAGSAGGER